MEIWKNGNREEKIIYDGGGFLDRGISILEVDTLIVFQEFVRAIESGAQRIRLTNYQGRFTEWDPNVTFESIASSPVQPKVSFVDQAIGKIRDTQKLNIKIRNYSADHFLWFGAT